MLGFSGHGELESMETEYDKLAEKLGENLALVLILLGALSFWLGTVGFKGFGIELRVSSQTQQTALQVFGALFSVAGVAFAWRREAPARISSFHDKNYVFTISSPEQNTRVGQHVHMSGTVNEVPPEGVAQIVEEVPGVYLYHPKGPLSFDPKLKKWTADFKTGGKVGDRRIFHVVIADESARQLFEYYSRVGRESGKWIAIRKLPPNTRKYVQVSVELTEASQ